MVGSRYCAEGGKPARYSLTSFGRAPAAESPALILPGLSSHSLASRPDLALILRDRPRAATAVQQPCSRWDSGRLLGAAAVLVWKHQRYADGQSEWVNSA
jgi:hypothetical protein